MLEELQSAFESARSHEQSQSVHLPFQLLVKNVGLQPKSIFCVGIGLSFPLLGDSSLPSVGFNNSRLWQLWGDLPSYGVRKTASWAARSSQYRVRLPFSFLALLTNNMDCCSSERTCLPTLGDKKNCLVGSQVVTISCKTLPSVVDQQHGKLCTTNPSCATPLTADLGTGQTVVPLLLCPGVELLKSGSPEAKGRSGVCPKFFHSFLLSWLGTSILRSINREVRASADGQTDRRYQTYYLPATRCSVVDKYAKILWSYWTSTLGVILGVFHWTTWGLAPLTCNMEGGSKMANASIFYGSF